MNGIMKYLIPMAFGSLAIYHLINANWVEGALYVSVSIGFPLMWAIRDGKITTNIKLWNAVSWALVILALLLFIVQLRLDAKV
jgi:hypothetical protein